MTSPFSFTASPTGILQKAYGDDDDEGGDDDDDDGGRGGDDDDADGRGGDYDGGRGGDYDGGRGGDDDDDDGERNSRSFRFNDDDRNLRQLLESLLQQDRDDDDDEDNNDNNNKQELNVEPKSYEGYGLKDEGDNRKIDINFAAAADFGCSENARNTVKNMEDKKPELVLPLGDLSVDKTATCWLDLISTFDDKSEITLGYHDVKDGVSKLNCWHYQSHRTPDYCYHN